MLPSQVHECELYRHEEQPLGGGMYTNMVTTIIGRKYYNQGSPPIYNTCMPESSYNEPRYSYHLTACSASAADARGLATPGASHASAPV